MSPELGNPHDRFFKEVWSRKAVGRDFLRRYLPPDVVALLDLNSLELTKDSFIDAKLRAHYADLLYRLKLKGGAPAFAYVLLEHKRTPERLTPFQLLRYMVRIWENTTQDEGQGLPPIIPVVVYQGDNPWPYGQTLQQVLQVPASLAQYVPDFRYELCDLSGLTDADIRGAVLLRVALLVMKHIADAKLAERLPDIFGLLRELGEKRTALGYLETLLRYLASATDKVTDHDIRNALVEVLPKLEETLMPTIAETWLEQGRAEGLAKGRDEGRAEGVQMGEKRVLVRLLELRFGTLPKAYQQRIAAADSETLLKWSERLLSAQQLPDIFAP